MGVLADNSAVVHADGAAPVIRRIRADEPWRWLEAGWADLRAVPAISLAYGFVFLSVSLSLAGFLFLSGLSALLPVFAAGFLLLGPLLAVGLYEASRRLENGAPVRLADVLFVSSRNLTQLALVGAMLAGAMIVWLQIAGWLFALFFGPVGIPPLSEFAPLLLLSPRGLALLVIGTAAGGIIAFAVFAMSAISVPLLLARDVDAVTAVLASVRAVRENFWTMLLWAWIVALLTAFGIATWFLGLAVIFPLLGHATWHAQRALVADA
ncbi:DUF2189 domain-containing protein [Parvibaculum sp.]|jgi:uncharacterized membrane protein|uniref:DUF2189 domain-containing protein n=1 Tax=Parvibaculum sp. TaxID=2024848 RepID=UPI001B28F69E|nr:DUF2189 domain-containing protein [Parvibaculum sp.]MBO6635596.1 DUF2189 domain-containing protein [Parvibaculum sp.]MBO6677184.1 DUF2189 domain-containing protein [Parvibaculum sp.]MBO6685155.1 DUF2189 domain-containing protein [Parvibaculum sp.]MBO6906148.1 DUF2189 domain-containing protein [Parvibaculum sp.]